MAWKGRQHRDFYSPLHLNLIKLSGLEDMNPYGPSEDMAGDVTRESKAEHIVRLKRDD